MGDKHGQPCNNCELLSLTVLDHRRPRGFVLQRRTSICSGILAGPWKTVVGKAETQAETLQGSQERLCC